MTEQGGPNDSECDQPDSSEVSAMHLTHGPTSGCLSFDHNFVSLVAR